MFFMDRHLTLFQMRMKAYGATFVVSPACTHGMRRREHEKKGRKKKTLNPFWCDVLAYGIHINALSLCFGVHHDLNNRYWPFSSHSAKRTEFPISDCAYKKALK